MPLTRRTLLQTSAAPALALQAGSQPPNILFLISDDHTWTDLGCYGNRAIRTPNLDRLAERGVRFDHSYVASPQCSPNRSAIFTGCTPHTTNTSRLHTPMPPWEWTFLDALKQRGYHLGAYRKVHQGKAFDSKWDFQAGAKEPFTTFFDKRPKDRPFFLHMGFTDPHRPYRRGAVSPPHEAKDVIVPPFLPDTPEVREDLAMYYDYTARMDRECGELFDLLDRHKVADNTLIIFVGDNGMAFPRAKGTLYDPGIRVPMLACWPGRTKPGSASQELIPHTDFAPTLCELAGAPVPAKVQGRSFAPLLTGRTYKPHEAVFSERNWHDNFDPIRSIRTARHKLIFNAAPNFPYRPALDIADGLSWKSLLAMAGRRPMKPEHRLMFEPNRPVLELYDLVKDPNEFHNLAASSAHHDLLEDMKSKLGRWMEQTYDFLPPAGERSEGLSRTWPLTL